VPKQTKCPNQNCDSREFEAVPMFQGTGRAAHVIQCRKCGTAIGAANSLSPVKNAIGNIEAKITGSKTV
jgi:aspartate carbamoyltransferase regulatory subunit